MRLKRDFFNISLYLLSFQTPSQHCTIHLLPHSHHSANTSDSHSSRSRDHQLSPLFEMCSLSNVGYFNQGALDCPTEGLPAWSRDEYWPIRSEYCWTCDLNAWGDLKNFVFWVTNAIQILTRRNVNVLWNFNTFFTRIFQNKFFTLQFSSNFKLKIQYSDEITDSLDCS